VRWIVTSLRSSARRREVLSMTSVTSARPSAARWVVPAKMTSSILASARRSDPAHRAPTRRRRRRSICPNRWADDDGHALLELDRRRVGEGLEALHGERPQVHTSRLPVALGPFGDAVVRCCVCHASWSSALAARTAVRGASADDRSHDRRRATRARRARSPVDGMVLLEGAGARRAGRGNGHRRATNHRLAPPPRAPPRSRWRAAPPRAA